MQDNIFNEETPTALSLTVTKYSVFQPFRDMLFRVSKFPGNPKNYNNININLDNKQ